MKKVFDAMITSDWLMTVLLTALIIAFIIFVTYSSIPEETSTARRYVRRSKKKIIFKVKQYAGSKVTRCDVSIGKYSKSYWIGSDYSQLTKKQKIRLKRKLIKELKKTIIDVIETAEIAKWLEGVK